VVILAIDFHSIVHKDQLIIPIFDTAMETIKVKVTELPKLRKVHFSKSISFAISAWTSKLMVGGHSMGPGLQLVGA